MKMGDLRQRYTFTATSQRGCDSGRRRYAVQCQDCGEVLHKATTGPLLLAEQHDAECPASPEPKAEPSLLRQICDIQRDEFLRRNKLVTRLAAHPETVDRLLSESGQARCRGVHIVTIMGPCGPIFVSENSDLEPGCFHCTGRVWVSPEAELAL